MTRIDSKLFLIFFSIATSLAILFQMMIAPNLAMGGGLSLIGADNLHFNKIATLVAERINREGWQVLSIYLPYNGATGNVALLAVLYALFGVDPMLVIPVNAALQATSAVLICKIARVIWRGEAGIYIGVIASAIFVLSPFSIIWYGQVLKDGYSICGVLFVIYSWILLSYRGGLLKSVAYCAIGLALCAFVRPYLVVLLFFAVSFLFFASLIRSVCGGEGFKNLLNKFLIFSFCAVLTSLTLQSSIESNPYSRKEVDRVGQHVTTYEWRATHWVPHIVDRGAELLAKTRAGLILSVEGVSANTNIDDAYIPTDIIDLLFYVPRALQVSLFAPFPGFLGQSDGFSWLNALISIGSMFWYVIAFGILIEIRHRNNVLVVDIILFCVVILAILGITSPNLGTLHRVRFPYISLLILIGVGGWLSFLQREYLLKGFLNSLRVDNRIANHCTKGERQELGRNKVFKSGIWVITLTIVAFVGFFARDIIVARTFGLGEELDAFVIAGVVPLFLISVVSVPLSNAVVPFVGVISNDSEAIGRLVRSILQWYLAAAVAIAVITILLFRVFAPTLGWGQRFENIVEVQLCWMLAIFILSGFLTVSSGVLNALGKPHVPAAVQLLVPLVVITSLVSFGKSMGLIIVPITMFAGQFLSLILLIRELNREGVFVSTSWRQMCIPKSFLEKYFPLVIANTFVQITIPVGTVISASLVSGDLGAIGLGGKLVVFITGLISTGLSSVILPYFSSIMAQNRVVDARRELSSLLLIGTIISLPLTLLLYMASSFIVKIFFYGGAFGEDSVLLLTSVMQCGVLQLPFYAVNMIMLKYAIAMNKSRLVAFSAFIGFIFNVPLSVFMGNLHGVAGISLAISITVALVASLMILVFFLQREIAWLDLIFIIVNWLLFFAIAVCLSFRNWVGVIAGLMAFSVMLHSEWDVVIRGRHAEVVT